MLYQDLMLFYMFKYKNHCKIQFASGTHDIYRKMPQQYFASVDNSNVYYLKKNV